MAAGKTIILAEIVRRLEGPVLILVNKSLLIKQIEEALNWAGITPAIYSASLNRKEIGNVTLGTIQSVCNYTGEFKFKTICVDEGHRFDFEYGQVAKIYGNCQVIGFTATPFTADGPIYGEGKVFTHKTYVRSIRTMTEEGHLVPLAYQGAKESVKLDFSKVKKNKDDYVLKDLQNVFTENEEKVKLQVEDALSKSTGYNKILVVTTGIKHAEMVYGQLENAAIIHSKQSKEEQAKNLASYKEGNTRILVSVLIVSEGFNDPPSQVLWLMRPTRSPVLYLQAAGRVLRKHPGKDHAVLLDYGNVVNELGSIYDLNEGKGTQKLKICTHCETYNKTTALICFKCSEPFLVMCGVCLKMHPYGKPCCTISKSIDRLKNLTLEAASINDWKNVDRVMIYMFKAKSGNSMPRVDYYRGFQLLASEFLFKMTLEDAKEIYSGVKRIKTIKVNGYPKVYERDC